MRGHRAILCLAVAAQFPLAVEAQPFPGERPDLSVGAPALGCPASSGAFVVLLDSRRGMLLLSAAGFEGAHRLGSANGGERDVAVPGSGAWPLERSTSAEGAPLWGNVYPWRGSGGDGCVAFAKQRFSSEGDLVTYARYLAEEVYMSLPAHERQRYPSFHLGDRAIDLEVTRPGYKALALHAREGATQAFSYPDTEGSLLLRPFVLDAATGRVAVVAATSDSPTWQGAATRPVGTFVAAIGSPVTIDALALTVAVTAVGRAATP